LTFYEEGISHVSYGEMIHFLLYRIILSVFVRIRTRSFCPATASRKYILSISLRVSRAPWYGIYTREPVILSPQGLSRHHHTRCAHLLCRYAASG